MSKHNAASPTASGGGDLQYDLHQMLRQQDGEISYQSHLAHINGTNDGHEPLSRATSVYSSPGPVTGNYPQRPSLDHAHSFDGAMVHLGQHTYAMSGTFDGFDSSGGLQHSLEQVELPNGGFQSSHQHRRDLPAFQAAPESTYPVPSLGRFEMSVPVPGHVLSPPTSTTSQKSRDSNSGSGRNLRRILDRIPKRTTGEKTLVAKPIKMRKSRKAGVKQELPTPKLTAPLSKLTEGFHSVPLRDIAAHVNRSTEVRQKEVSTRGRVPRPMNCFMLYRSAYANRTKMWCLQNNHQLLSRIAGSSWPLESPDLRALFMAYAKIEQGNHAKAHPGYKFNPSKVTTATAAAAATASKKRKQNKKTDDLQDFSDSDPSDLDDFVSLSDTNDTASTFMTKPSSARQGAEREASFSPYPGEPVESIHHQSSYQAANPGQPLPMVIGGQPDLSGQYYQTTIHPNARMAGVEDLTLRMIEAPGGHAGENHGLTSLPGGWHYELFQRSLAPTPAPMEDNLDPYLRTQYVLSADGRSEEILYGNGSLYPSVPAPTAVHYQQALDQNTMTDGLMPSYLDAAPMENMQPMELWENEVKDDIVPPTGWYSWPDQN